MEVGRRAWSDRWRQARGSAGAIIVDDAGDERGLESTVTVLGVYCRVGSTGFGGCVGFDCIIFRDDCYRQGKYG